MNTFRHLCKTDRCRPLGDVGMHRVRLFRQAVRVSVCVAVESSTVPDSKLSRVVKEHKERGHVI